MEEWRQIPFNRLYEVSNKGRVRNVKSGKILTTNPTKSHKRPQVWLWTKHFGTTCQYSLANLVYFSFNPLCPYFEKKKHIHHIDGDIMNCNLNNLYVK